ncbi:hypothetical protein A2U01_0087201, partial [Trifolium medium]|nr:hypothetical protein [Trifolium medium]
GAKLGAV